MLENYQTLAMILPRNLLLHTEFTVITVSFGIFRFFRTMHCSIHVLQHLFITTGLSITL